MFYIKSYKSAKTISEAITISKKQINTQFIAGGTDILIKNREKKEKFINNNLIGIMEIEEFKKIILKPNEDIFIGSTVTFSEIENNTILKKYLNTLCIAASTIGGPQLRNMGTIGGNICNGATSADMASSLLCYNAIVIIIDKDNKEKHIPINSFYLDFGKVNLKEKELVKGFLIKKIDYKDFKGYYIKFSQRKALDIATLGCSVLLKTKQNKINIIRIAYGVAAPKPIRAIEAEIYAKGLEINKKNLISLGEKCLLSTKPRDSWRASKSFRENLIKVLPIQAIEFILGEKENE